MMNSGDFELHGEFETKLFSNLYQRNNKRGGLKNLRCFPTCGAQHKERGFCGRPVLVTVQVPDSVQVNEIVCRAEFSTVGSKPRVQVGGTISESELNALERGKDDPIKPIVRGDLSQSATPGNGQAVFELNRERKGWHYGWASNKHMCNSSHELLCYLFEPVHGSNPAQLICRSIARSPQFMLFCRRRRRFHIEPSAPIALPAKAALASRLAESQLPKVKVELCEAGSGGFQTPLSSESVSVAPNATPRKRKLAVSNLKSELSEVTSCSSGSDDEKHAVKKVRGEPKAARKPREKKRIDVRRLNHMLRGVAHIIAKIKSDPFVAPKDSSASPSRMPPLPPAGEPIGEGILETDMLESTQDILEDLTGDADGFRSRSDSLAGRTQNDHGAVKTKQAVVESLVAYLVHESSMTRAIQSLGLHDSERPAKSKEYRAFVDLMVKNVEGFMAKHSLSLEQFDEIFDVCPSPGSESDATEPDLDLALDMQQGIDSFSLDNEIKDLCDSLGTGGDGLATLFDNIPDTWAGLLDCSNDALSLGDYNCMEDEDERSINIAAQRALPDTVISRGGKMRKRRSGVGKFVEDVSTAFSSLMSSKKVALSLDEAHNSSGSTQQNGKRVHATRQRLKGDSLSWPNVSNLSGKWTRCDDGAGELTELRQRCGIPWVLCKMLEFMESSFEIDHTEQSLKVRLRSKLLSDGALVVNLDGVERPFDMRLPVLTGICKSWKLCGSVQGGKVIVSHIVGTRMLHWALGLESGELRGTVTLLARKRNEFERVASVDLRARQQLQ